MQEYCSSCPFSEKRKSSEKSNEYNNWFCVYRTSSEILENKPPIYRSCGSWIHKDVKLLAPQWCPKTKQPQQRESRLVSPKSYNDWSKLPYMHQWEDFKEQTIYHIPPVNGDVRLNIIVLKKYDTYMTCRVVGGKDNGKLMTLYKTSLKTKFLTEDRIEKKLLTKSICYAK